MKFISQEKKENNQVELKFQIDAATFEGAVTKVFKKRAPKITVPGFRPGRPTAEFLSKVLARLTFFGAIYLGIVAILPIITENITGIVNMSIGGTSVIIVVGVALETVKQIEAQMLMRHYKGFLE